MKAEVITVGTTPTIVMGSNALGNGAGSGSVSYPTAGIIRIPSGAVTVYFGGSQVSTSDGCPFVAGEDLETDLVNEILYAVVASGTQNIYVLRRGD